MKGQARSVCLLICTLLVFLKIQSTEGISRLEKLQQETSGSSKIVKLDYEKLKLHATTKHEYSLFVFFTSSAAEIPCPHCKDIQLEFNALVKSFYESLGSKGYNNPNFGNHPLFFATCEVTDCKQLFMEAQWNSIPKLVHIPPREDKGNLQIETFVDMEGLMEDPSSASMADFVNQRSGYPIQVARPLFATILTVLGAIMLLFIIVRHVLPTILRKYKDPMFWFAISVGIFGFVMAGPVFNAINKPPMYYKNPYNGQLHLIYPNARMQFVAEGVLMGILLAVAGVLITAVGCYLPNHTDATKKRNYFIPLFLATVASYVAVFHIFKIKYPYYPF